MLIRSLRLENYRRFKQVDLDLPEAVIGIIGPNGAGKTTLIEAVAWALYGTAAARTGKEDVRTSEADSTDPCRAVLRFDLHGQTYELERQLLGRSHRAEATLKDAGGNLLAVSASDVQAAVARMLGLDFKGFLTSYLARQQELNALSDLVPSKRREHLAGMLGVDRLDRALVELRAELKASNTEISLLTDHLSARQALAESVKDLSEQVSELAKRAQATAGARDRAKQVLTGASEHLQALQYRRARCSDLTARLETARSTEKELQGRRLQLEHEATELQAATTEVEKLERLLAAEAATKTQYEKLRQAKNNQLMREEISRQRTEASDKAQQLEATIKRDQAAVAEVEKDLAKLPDDVPSRIARVQEALEAKREHYSETLAAVKTLKQVVVRLTERLEDMSAVGAEATCDRCGRAFGEDLDSIRRHFESELTRTETELRKKQADLEKVRQAGDKLKNDQALLEQHRSRSERLKHQLETARSCGNSTIPTSNGRPPINAWPNYRPIRCRPKR